LLLTPLTYKAQDQADLMKICQSLHNPREFQAAYNALIDRFINVQPRDIITDAWRWMEIVVPATQDNDHDDQIIQRGAQSAHMNIQGSSLTARMEGYVPEINTIVACVGEEFGGYWLGKVIKVHRAQVTVTWFIQNPLTKGYKLDDKHLETNDDKIYCDAILSTDVPIYPPDWVVRPSIHLLLMAKVEQRRLRNL
jgi:hypothetical protein